MSRLGYDIENLLVIKHNLPTLLSQTQINTVQEEILSQCWLGLTYREIADRLGYNQSYIRLMGTQLWQLLSENLGQKVTKSNFQSILMHRITEMNSGSLNNPELACSSANASCPSSKFVQSHYSVLENYIERFPIESQCHKAILQEGALIRIKAPQEMGKTLLMSHILNHVQQLGMNVVVLSLRLADADTFASLDKFLQWFCLNVCDQLNVENKLQTQWDDCLSSSYNCTNYLERVILPQVEGAMVIALDDVDVLFPYPTIASDFFGMLRAWCEKAKHVNVSGQIWRRCRMIVVHSTEVYIPLNKHQSPFNIGLSIDLPEFEPSQVALLAQQFNLTLDDREMEQLIDLVGGKPKLIKLAFTWLLAQGTTFSDLLNNTYSPTSPFYDHLRSQYRKLQQYPELLSSLEKIVISDQAIAIAPIQGFQLESLGLIAIESGMRARLSCSLYRQYFRQLFEQT